MSTSSIDAERWMDELVERAETEGPQTITRHGTDVAVVVSIDVYRKLTESRPSLAEFLLAEGGPYLDDLDLERRKDMPREIEL